ncbi:helix-turn-helix transcriptional regulator [Lachnospiraceae bacterium MD308]|nr:helix-turn-helix transcriptional regulator [Lachnospiraceae bacterium MD308]
MNQNEIGKFIASCRKEKGLTQMQLAEQLNITNRAVSKWETGKSIPDVSIMMELCDILGITVNELLSGERIAMEDYKAKAEENMLLLQEKKAKAEKDFRRVEKIWLIVAVLLTPIHFAINYYFPNNNGTGIGLVILFIGLIMYTVYFGQHYEIRLK